ncbi:L,D-transpeptidase family protein [Photobacterium damselae]|uniref:L,D-transpeptidase family protein n=1 Tax=Photobacterium damselae TaxID=38293 RepID=UPI001EDEEC4D|nr:L,D-transpeptidase family protein [Photobacterium damselae]MCG3823211.1 L,D-transpeptidase family protein [Photobacterium damselae]
MMKTFSTLSLCIACTLGYSCQIHAYHLDIEPFPLEQKNAMDNAMHIEIAQLYDPSRDVGSTQLDHYFNPKYQAALDWVKDIPSIQSVISYPDKLAEIYYTNGYQPYWSSKEAVEALLASLKVFEIAKISPDLTKRYTKIMQLKNTPDWKQIDLLATDTMLALLSFYQYSKHEQREWLFGGKMRWPLPLPSHHEVESFLTASETAQMVKYISSLQGNNEQYTSNIKALEKLTQLSHKRWPIFHVANKVSLGNPLPNAKNLITILEMLGDLPSYQAEQMLTENLDYLSPTLIEAVKSFQQRHGLSPDGVIGPNTLYWLSKSPQERLRVVALNTLRLSLWPDEQPNQIVVNIPAYELTARLNNQSVMTSKVIVGRPSRNTPMMDSTITSVVFNPYWNVPTSIMRKDILPKVKRNPSYLTRNRYEILSSWSNPARISVNAINWRGVNPKTFPYRLRQKPGNKNALGRFKFNIPNDYAIYLHDTSSKRLFNKSDRALSSGCVRVEYAKGLAQLLLEYSGVSDKRFIQYSSRTRTKTVVLKNKIPVHLIYQTAWAEGNGLIYYRDDIYHYDKMGGASQNGKLYITAYNY